MKPPRKPMGGAFRKQALACSLKVPSLRAAGDRHRQLVNMALLSTTRPPDMSPHEYARQIAERVEERRIARLAS